MKFVEHNMKNIVRLFFVLGLLMMVYSCAGPSRSVTRVATDETSDISGRWNDSDARMTSDYMLNKLLSGGWLTNFEEKDNRKPVLIIGKIENRTSEHLDVMVFVSEIEQDLVNSGEVTFVASAKERTGVRDERMDQQSYANEESAKELANEQAADFMLRGTITSVVDKFESQRTVLYKVNLELIDIENNLKVWMGNKEIKKYIKQGRYQW